VLFVDDGSEDGSDRLLEEIVEANPGWKCLHLSRNFGHQAAVSAGLDYAEGDAVVVMDGDLQDPPEVIGELLDHWRDGFDVVYGVRRQRPEPLWKRLSYQFFYRLMALWSTVRMPTDAGDFCLLDRRVVDVMVRGFSERERFLRGLRAYAGFRQIGVPYERGRRAGGETKYTLRALFRLALSGLFGFSYAPLRWIWYLGVLLALAAAATLAGEVGWLGVGRQDLPAWSSLLTLSLLPAFLLLSSVHFFALAVLGEYVSRIHLEVKRRPDYIVERSSPARRSEVRWGEARVDVPRLSGFAAAARGQEADGSTASGSVRAARSRARSADRVE
jgi:dolichol-phosphate mannosyltransferase